MTLPAAGWFPDPQDASRLRWWDGRTWGEGTRALPARAEAVLPVAVAPVGPSFSVGTAAARTRPWASGAGTARRLCAVTLVAAIAAVASVVVNPFGLCSLVALLAGLFAVIAPRATGGWRVLSRSIAASALVVAVSTAAVAASAQFRLF
ncbi:hypothetical protein JOE58_002053 [Curtobacterium luteum]|uniref:DUF2510 domain-containing protein n=1 Tax=Curtobacterium luteum TaxID=33881 RepID=A0A8H9GB86_9MICO|nr:DUF2510 domain-containing protein [Curtobacterium luteum]MBM7802802.1 hypothetical protein [Curtobacterium luteum]NUU51267.1 DUF2510 domain-containing protein [Curtobacterium luteum]GGL12346.1 hypothetical protein GCM10009769_32940 [Curtobacterium luteum]